VLDVLWKSLSPDNNEIMTNIQLLPKLFNPKALPYLVLRKLSWLGHMTAELDISENQFSLSLACGSRHIGSAQLST
jgi:hypothetical protein